MRRTQTVRQTGSWLLMAAISLAISGCGTADYNRLSNERLGELRAAAKFQGLFAPTPLDDTPLSIRIPVEFTKSYKPDSAYPDDGDKIDPKRVQPPFMVIPGLKVTYEEAASGPNGILVPFYCYVAAIPSKPGDADKLQADILAQLKETFKDGVGAWEAKDCLMISGTVLQWHMLRAVGDQPFLVKENGKKTAQNLPGIFEIWIYDSQQYIVLVGWRTPTAFTPQPPPAQGEAAPPPAVSVTKLDMAQMPVLTAGTLAGNAAAAPEPAPGQPAQ